MAEKREAELEAEVASLRRTLCGVGIVALSASGEFAIEEDERGTITLIKRVV